MSNSPFFFDWNFLPSFLRMSVGYRFIRQRQWWMGRVVQHPMLEEDTLATKVWVMCIFIGIFKGGLTSQVSGKILDSLQVKEQLGQLFYSYFLEKEELLKICKLLSTKVAVNQIEFYSTIKFKYHTHLFKLDFYEKQIMR